MSRSLMLMQHGGCCCVDSSCLYILCQNLQESSPCVMVRRACLVVLRLLLQLVNPLCTLSLLHAPLNISCGQSGIQAGCSYAG